MKCQGFGPGSRTSIGVLPALALGLCVAIGCSGASDDGHSPSDRTNGGQTCSSEGGNVVSGGGGDVELRVCTGGSSGGETSGGCTPGTEGCPSSGNGGSDGCVPGTEGCPSGGTGGSDGCVPGTEGCPSGGKGGSGGDCTPGTEGCPSGGKGGSGGDTGGGCTPGTEGCPSTGEGGSGGGGSGGSSGGGGSGGSGGPCTLTQGYWKNHPEAWPVTSLTIGGVTYAQADLLAIFAMDPSGDASLVLADQLIAALLNQAAAVTPPAGAAQAIADAQAWMAANADADGQLPYGTPMGSDAANAATALASTLDDFNNGLSGVAHCP